MIVSTKSNYPLDVYVGTMNKWLKDYTGELNLTLIIDIFHKDTHLCTHYLCI